MGKKTTSLTKKNKYKQNFETVKKHKADRKAKWERNREKWANDKAYQEKQKQREIRLKKLE